MKKLRVGIIGCGNRGGAHAQGYFALGDRVELAAVADTYLPAARRFKEQYGFKKVYTDYREMLVKEKLDVVSMCLWPKLHRQAVVDCASLLHPPKLINAEKPMAPTFGEALEMHNACVDRGIMLTFSHQRRFGWQYCRAKELLDSGVIGKLERMEMDCSNMFDWGTHWFDMMNFLNGDVEPSWIMAQIGCAADVQVFGAQIETAGVSYIKYTNGVTGLLTTGKGTGAPVLIRLEGSDGRIDLGWKNIRILSAGKGWQEEICPDGFPEDTTRHIAHCIDCLEGGRTPITGSDNALRATEMIFATYLSSRTRKRVFMPLDIEDSPLLTMLDQKELVIPPWPTFVSDEEEEQGFKLFFNGKSLRGFTQKPLRSWKADNGLLRCAKEESVIWLDRNVGDFEIRFEHRLGSRSQAGFLFWGNPEKGARSAFEIVLADDRFEPLDTAVTAALRGMAAPVKNLGAQAANWIWMRIRCRNGRLTVDSFGPKLLDVSLDEISAAAKHSRSGALGFVLHSGTFDVRSVIYTETPSEEEDGLPARR